MTTSINLSITGLSCASCVGHAERAIADVSGVESVTVNLATETAALALADTSQLPEIIRALDGEGYPAVQQTIHLTVEGMTCASCVARIENQLEAIPGVLRVSVNFATEQVTVDYLQQVTSPEAIAKVIAGAGYRPVSDARVTDSESLRAQQTVRKEQEADAVWKSFLLAAVLTLPVFVVEMGSHFIPGMHEFIERTLGHRTSWFIQFVLITLVLLGPGRRFFQLGVPALLRAAPEMNSLVALGTTAAWGYSVVVLFLPELFNHGTRVVYFEAAGVITVLILLGRYLEARAKGRTGVAITRLIGLRPKTASVERGREIVATDISQIQPGDILHVRPGERFAVDGNITGGDSYIDESMITGEPVPVAKSIGDTVVAGTINGSGAINFRATAIGEDTLLAQIIRMVEDAQGAKLPIQTLVDRVTAVFVPLVIALAFFTVLLWLFFGPPNSLSLALVTGVSVLIIACPCAMGLATPTSIMVGTGRAAELGVLFRKGDALQGLRDTTVVALDKTGTLTAGKPELTSLALTESWSRDTVLPLLASVETRSEHPIAQAIVRAASGMKIPEAEQFTAVAGMGVRARVEGYSVIVGADRFMADERIALGDLQARAEAFAADGQTPFYAAIDGVAVAALGVSDPIKEGTREAIDALHAQGLQVAMITGDNRKSATVIASQLGIDHVVAQVLPDGKVSALNELRANGEQLAYVGDGINDAPALASADAGIAIGTGTDIAIESADVVLISGDLRGVVNALELSRQTMRNIRQNLFWAFAYNVALIPVAAGILYPAFAVLLSPMLAAAAMALSSVFVVTNALRLRAVAPLL
ncbi:copper-translocating P-type ATPase [Chromatiales bacterium (ex Bugula neritina AB1)]|nr:copper-translocating P-type ATPase [Chromatiales bacterium (ex Bugula neritina AB1)]